MRAELFQFQHKYFQRFANGRCAFFLLLFWWFWIWSWLAIYIRYIVWYICSIFLRRAFFWIFGRWDETTCAVRASQFHPQTPLNFFLVQLEWKNAVQNIHSNYCLWKLRTFVEFVFSSFWAHYTHYSNICLNIFLYICLAKCYERSVFVMKFNINSISSSIFLQ